MNTQTYLNIEANYRHDNIVKDYNRSETNRIGLPTILEALRTRFQVWMAVSEEPMSGNFGHLQTNAVG